jgi:hypothetical protein
MHATRTYPNHLILRDLIWRGAEMYTIDDQQTSVNLRSTGCLSLCRLAYKKLWEGVMTYIEHCNEPRAGPEKKLLN